MTKFTAAEKLENIDRTIAATEITLAEMKAKFEELNAAHRVNLNERRSLFAEISAQNTDKARWMRATKALRKDGVKFLSNVQKCCRGCIDAETLGLKEGDTTTPYGYTYGGQGGRVTWSEYSGHAEQKSETRNRGFRYNREVEPVTVYINHGNGSGEKIAEAFRAEGLKVEWDGSESACVEVTFVTL